MIVLVGFLIVVFLISATREAQGRTFSTRWLFLFTLVAAASFYSIRVIS
ncbi:MAG: hypothetical protein Q8M22_07210 [Actinomycetota bacterium]|nr:hypothetical protein [Actinomycetota bacterium]